MRKLLVFNQVSLDGYFTDVKGDMSWAHKQDAEWNAFVAENAKGESQLVFGRITYELMASFWPTPAALAGFPVVAARMNSVPKVVFSKTLQQAAWNNTALLKGDLATEIRRMKQGPGPDLVVMGSGTIVSQLAAEGLIDELQIVVNPIVLGNGRSLFAGVGRNLALKRTGVRAFGNGNIMLTYTPTA